MSSDVVLVPVELPVGVYLKESGSFEKRAVIVKATGAVRAAVGAPSVRKNFARVVDVILQNCLRTLGEKKPSISQVQRLAVADREFLLMKIREISLGSTIETEMACPTCGATNAASASITEFGVTTPESLGLEIDPEHGWVLNVMLPDKKEKVTCRIMTGVEQSIIGAIGDEGNLTATLFRVMRECCVYRNGEPTSVVGPLLVESLSLADTDTIEEEFQSKNPAVQNNIALPCISCGSELTFLFPVLDFLFRRQPRERT